MDGVTRSSSLAHGSCTRSRPPGLSGAQSQPSAPAGSGRWPRAQGLTHTTLNSRRRTAREPYLLHSINTIQTNVQAQLQDIWKIPVDLRYVCNIIVLGIYVANETVREFASDLTNAEARSLGNGVTAAAGGLPSSALPSSAVGAGGASRASVW